MPNVVIQDIDRDTEFDPQGLSAANSFAGTIWEDYEIHSTYDKNYHRYCMGVTVPVRQETVLQTIPGRTAPPSKRPTVSIVQLCNPTLIWKADWTAARYNTKPYIPSANIGGLEWVLLEEKIDPGMITLAADGVTPLYRISGTYVFANVYPSGKLYENVDFGIPPWVDASSFDRSVPDEMFKDNIISRPYPKPPPDTIG